MRGTALCGIGLLFLLLCSACTAIAPPSISDTLRVGIYAEPESLNPLLGNLTIDDFLSSLAFDELVTVDSSGDDIPDLAAEVPTLRNGDISKSGLTIRYRLRKDARWQDGAEFTSADVRFSWKAVMNPLNNVATRVGFDDVTSVDTPNRFTVVFHLKRPYAPFVDTVFGESGHSYRVLPAHLLARYSDLNRVPFNQQPIGTGPFRVARWVRGDYVEYIANPRYFRGAPKLRRIRVSFLPNDNTLEIKVRAHEIDLAAGLTPVVYEAVRSVPGFRAIEVRIPAFTALEMNVKRPALSDVRVRRAIAYGVDKERLLQDLMYGTEDVAASDIAPYYRWAYEPNVRTYGYDPAKAQRLLDEAGWIRGANGLRAKRGTPLSLQIVHMSGSQNSARISAVIQYALAQIGIDTVIKAYPANVLWGSAPRAILNSGRYDIEIDGWDKGADPDDSSEWLCDEVPPTGENITRYCNPKLDVQERVALTHFDRATRRRAYQRIQEILAEDVPADFTGYPKLLCVASSRLRRFSPGVSIGWNAYEWSW